MESIVEIAQPLQDDLSQYLKKLREYRDDLETALDNALKLEMLDARMVKDMMATYNSVNDAILTHQGVQYVDLNNAVTALNKNGYKVVNPNLKA